MLRTRVIPCLLLRGQGLVKTVKFDKAQYLGDPVNTVKIFNDKEVDELVILDITATPDGREPRFDLIREIVSEAFMPIGYGGGLRTVEACHRMLTLGVEKVILNSAAVERPALITEAAERFGSQSVVVSIDAKRKMLGRTEVYTHGGRRGTKRDPIAWSREAMERGAGEILLTAIDRDGTMTGYDLELLRGVTDAVRIPVVVCGGAGSTQDFARAVTEGGASGVAAGSLFVYHGKHRAVLINYPSPAELAAVLP